MKRKRSGRSLWLVIVFVVASAGCGLDQRNVVVRPEAVGSQNDTDWKIIKQPQRPPQTEAR